jgi:hypothetical protein
MCALKGIQNVLTGTRSSTHHEMLGPLLAALKVGKVSFDGSLISRGGGKNN